MEVFYDEISGQVELCKGSIDGYEYRIVCNGVNPCCYITLPQNHKLSTLNVKKLRKMSYSGELGIGVHGGITWVSRENNSICLGWDYAHVPMDYIGFMGERSGGKKWTVEEIKKDVVQGVKSLISYNE